MSRWRCAFAVGLRQTISLTALGATVALTACGPARESGRRPPQAANSAYATPDGGLPVLPPSGSGIIAPGDPATSGVSRSGAAPGTNTGTSGQPAGPTTGGPGSN